MDTFPNLNPSGSFTFKAADTARRLADYPEGQQDDLTLYGETTLTFVLTQDEHAVYRAFLQRMGFNRAFTANWVNMLGLPNAELRFAAVPVTEVQGDYWIVQQGFAVRAIPELLDRDYQLVVAANDSHGLVATQNVTVSLRYRLRCPLRDGLAVTEVMPLDSVTFEAGNTRRRKRWHGSRRQLKCRFRERALRGFWAWYAITLRHGVAPFIPAWLDSAMMGAQSLIFMTAPSVTVANGVGLISAEFWEYVAN